MVFTKTLINFFIKNQVSIQRNEIKLTIIINKINREQKSQRSFIYIKITLLQKVMELNIPASSDNLQFITGQIISMAGISGFVTFTYPLEMIRTRIQTGPELIKQKRLLIAYHGILDCVKRVNKQEGVRAFWKGNFANLLRTVPNQTFNFFIKQTIKYWTQKNNFVKNQTVLNFFSGSIGAIFTLIFIYPLEFARARLINEILGRSTILEVLIKTYKIEGLQGIYRGSLNFFISAAIFRAFYFGIYDSIKNIDPNNLTQRIIGSYIGSISAIYSVYPFDTIRKRMMMTSGQGYKYGGFINCAITLYKLEGLSTFYRGWQLSLGQACGAAGSLLLFDKIGSDVKKKNRI